VEENSDDFNVQEDDDDIEYGESASNSDADTIKERFSESSHDELGKRLLCSQVECSKMRIKLEEKDMLISSLSDHIKTLKELNGEQQSQIQALKTQLGGGNLAFEQSVTSSKKTSY